MKKWKRKGGAWRLYGDGLHQVRVQKVVILDKKGKVVDEQFQVKTAIEGGRWGPAKGFKSLAAAKREGEKRLIPPMIKGERCWG